MLETNKDQGVKLNFDDKLNYEVHRIHVQAIQACIDGASNAIDEQAYRFMLTACKSDFQKLRKRVMNQRLHSHLLSNNRLN